jgi:hypothetical protein
MDMPDLTPKLTVTVAADGLLKLEDIAKLAGCSRRTVTVWASDRQPFARRLKVMRFGHSTVRVRPADWLKFQEANLR